MTANTSKNASPYVFLLGITTLLFIMMLPLASFGQTSLGSVSIRVVDPNGAVVPGASVTIKRTGTDQTFVGVTNNEGEIVFSKLPSGNYSVTVESPGFTRAASVPFTVTIGQAQTLEVTLQPGGEQTVTVEPGTVEPDFSALPNLNNDLTPFLQVVPGAVPTGASALGRIIIDGRGQSNNHLDGIDVTSQIDLPTGDSSLDSVSSFQKPEVALGKPNPVSGAFAPNTGPGTGVVVDDTTYSGSSPWKGQIYGDIKNSAFNARNFFEYEGKNAIRRSRFGGMTGGPIGRIGSVFFGYEGVRGRTARNIYEAVPVEAICGCSGGILSPTLRGFLPTGTQVVTGASLNPDFAVARRRPSFRTAANVLNVRFDSNQIKGTDGLLSFRYTRQVAVNDIPDGVTGRRQSQRISYNNLFTQFARIAGNTEQYFRFGFFGTRVMIDSATDPSLNPQLAQSLLSVSGTVPTTGLPSDIIAPMPVATLGRLIKGVGRGYDLAPRSYSAIYLLNLKMSAKHVIDMGVEARFLQFRYDRLGGLTYSFPNVVALRNALPSGVSFLSDLSAPSPFSDGSGPRNARQRYFLSFFQDAWKIRPTLKLTYGLRYDYFSSVSEADHRAVVVDPQTGVQLPRGTAFAQGSKNGFQPRVGLIYSTAPVDDLKTSRDNYTFTFGAGLYLGPPRFGDLLLPIDSDRYSTGITGGTFPYNSSDIVANFNNNPDTRQYQPLTFARNFIIPERAYKWEMSFTRTYKGVGLKAQYSGNAGRNLPLANIANPILSVTTNADPTQPAIIVRQFDRIQGNQVLKPYGEFSYRSSAGHSNYHGVTFSASWAADKTDLPDWLNASTFSIQYTWARSTGNVSGAIASNPQDFGADDGFNASDARHSFSLSAVYNLWQLGGGSTEMHGLRGILFGWTLAPSIKASSGTPLQIKLDRPDVVYVDGTGNVFSSPAVGRHAVINTPGGGSSGASRVPNLLPGVNPYLNNDREYLNPAAFAIPAPGTFGNFRRGQLRGPASYVVNVAILRTLVNREKLTLDFRTEINNLLNHTNFSYPTASLPNSLGTSAADNQIQPGQPFARGSAGTFGIFSASDIPRQIQFKVILKFNKGITSFLSN